MKRLLFVPAMALICVLLSGYVRADCVDSTYHCYQNEGEGSCVGTIVMGNCWNWFPPGCRICGGSYEAATQKCNSTYPQCNGNCWACVQYVDTGGVAYCYDKSGNCRGYGCGW